MSNWSKGKAVQMRRFIAGDTWKAFLEDAKAGAPKVKDAKNLEEAALLAARKEGREEIIQEMLDACEWDETSQDGGNTHEVL